MTYETIPIEAKDADRVHILTGTIVSTGDGVAEVNIDDYGIIADVPIFYHCPKSETADTMPFIENERVLIINSGSAATPSIANMKVFGFEDGLPRGDFRFRLTREDDINPDNHTLLTNVHDMRHSFVDSNGNWIWTDWEYNTTTEYWDLTFHDPNHRSGSWDDPSPNLDPNGYWIWYWSNLIATNVLNTQYPHRYKFADQQNNDDLIKPGAYKGLLPYWKTALGWNKDITDACTGACPAEFYVSSFRVQFNAPFAQILTVYSSVPYIVSYKTGSSRMWLYGLRRFTDICLNSTYCLDGGRDGGISVKVSSADGVYNRTITHGSVPYIKTQTGIREPSILGTDYVNNFTPDIGSPVEITCLDYSGQQKTDIGTPVGVEFYDKRLWIQAYYDF